MEKNIQDAELEALLEYDSTKEFSDTDSLNGMSDNEYEIEDIAEGKEEEEEEKEEKENTMKLYIGKTFYKWDRVANFMKKYAATKGHGLSPNHRKNKLHLAELNIHRDHELHLSAIKFVPTLRKLSDEIIEEIRFLTVVAKADATIQYRIIREKFKIRIYRSDLYNTISKFHRELTPDEADAGILLKRLHKKKMEDPRWVVSMKLDPITSSLTHLFWMSLEQQILWLHYHDVIMWEILLQNYPQAKDYLIRSLGCNFQSWARAFTSKYFTADAQTTFRNEGENSVLKQLFGNSNLSLCELFDALEERYQEEVDYCEFINWHQTIPQIRPQNVSTSIFGPVAQQLNEFVMLNIMKKQEEQMELSLC
ncbi:unnamed protein product [Rhizophagus irregularis]|nr:unnamed protein product [Rhizophagus irregularis]